MSEPDVDMALDPTSPLPRYYQIYSALRRRIAAGDPPAGHALPPERHIAERYGVARQTVVKALDLLERDGLIDRQHGRGTFVLDASERAGVPPAMVAFIGSQSLSPNLMLGISQTAFEHQYQLQMLSVDPKFDHLGAYLDACLASGVQGFLIYGRPGSGDVSLYRRLLAQGVPIVLVDRYYPGLACDRVLYDNVEASARLTDMLLARGHRRIAVLPGPELDTSAVRDRLRGYRQALDGRGVPYDEDLLWIDLYSAARPDGVIADGHEALAALLEACGPTAIIAINDQIARNLVHDLLALHRSLAAAGEGAAEAVPEPGDTTPSPLELELATFTDQPGVDPAYFHVAAVHPNALLGRTSARLLIDRLGGVGGAPTEVVVPMDVVEHPSTPPPFSQRRGDERREVKGRSA